VKMLANKSVDVQVYQNAMPWYTIRSQHVSTDRWTTLSFDLPIGSGTTNLTFGYWISSVADVVIDDLVVAIILGEPGTTPTPPVYTVSLGCLSAVDLFTTGDTAYDTYMNAHGVTSVTYRASYFSPTILGTTTVHPVTKTASFTNVPDGTYVVSVSRAGYMIRDIAVSVAGGNVTLGDKSLLAGDLFPDGTIDGSDSEALFSAISTTYGDPGYVPEYDIYFDGSIDGTDSEMVFAVMTFDVTIYGENVDYYN